MWGIRGPSVGPFHHFPFIAERLRKKISGIRPRSSVLRPVVTSRLNHPYPAEGAGVRAPGQAVASPSGRSVAEWSVLLSFSSLDPFPSFPFLSLPLCMCPFPPCVPRVGTGALPICGQYGDLLCERDSMRTRERKNIVRVCGRMHGYIPSITGGYPFRLACVCGPVRIYSCTRADTRTTPVCARVEGHR